MEIRKATINDIPELVSLMEQLGYPTSVDKLELRFNAALKKLFNPNGITICQNGGKFNDLTHYHMHVIPRFEGEPFYYEEQKDNIKEKAKFLETKTNLKSLIEELS